MTREEDMIADKMALEEVIETLQTWIATADDEYDREEMGRVCGLKEALHEIKKIKPCTDAISRQAAIDAIYACYIGGKEAVDKAPYSDHYAEGIDEAVNAVEELPSVSCSENMNRCKDAVSRQEVLDLIADYDLSMGQVVRGIYALSSVTPIRPKGHWRPIYQGDEIINYRCSECEFGNTFGKGTIGMNFCPNCGADMVEPQESEDNG